MRLENLSFACELLVFNFAKIERKVIKVNRHLTLVQLFSWIFEVLSELL